MRPTRKQLYDPANNFDKVATIQLLEKDNTYSLFLVTYDDKEYTFCIALRTNTYTGDAVQFHLRNRSEKFAKSLCWKKIIEPSL